MHLARMSARYLRLVLPLVLLTAVGCQSPSSHVGRIYADLEAEVRDKDPVRLPAADAEAVHRQRADDVRKIVDKEGLSTADDNFKAAVILVGTSRMPDLDLAETLARRSSQLGEPHGLRVAAEAVDKRAMLMGRPQKYGTQYVFEWVLDSWRLYPIDVMTTDTERAEMGVPTYAELLAAEDAMNTAQHKKLRPH
jgi:hypothetical protein